MVIIGKHVNLFLYGSILLDLATSLWHIIKLIKSNSNNNKGFNKNKFVFREIK